MTGSRTGDQIVPSIESIGGPLSFKLRDHRGLPKMESPGRLHVRSEVRALEGMQKEALVHHGPDGSTWRMVSDEGPYLNGTDLAPFPLAFYTAGVVFSFMTEVLAHAAAQGTEVGDFAVSSDHYYTMQGSALRGNMVGGAKSIDLTVAIEADAAREQIAQILDLGLAASPAEAYMRDRIENTFSVAANGQALALQTLRSSPQPIDGSATSFDSLQPANGEFADGIIAKLSEAEVLEGVAGGAGSSLQAVQKRDLHVRGEARMLTSTLKEIQVRLLQPIGSSFRLLCEDGGEQQAPPALGYLSAGIGFCFMTQIGRYAQITKRALDTYRIVQDNNFTRAEPGGQAAADPVDTSLYLTLDESDEVAQQIAFMGEQTCFLHAALRDAYPTRIHLP